MSVASYLRAVGAGVDVLASLEGAPVLDASGRVLAATFHPELVDDDRPHRDYSDLLPIGLALLLTICGIAMFFFNFSIATPVKEKPAPAPTEVTVGIGQGSTIRPNPPAHP